MNRTPPTAIVTGASRGIGRAIANALATQHYNLVINYHRNTQAAQETADSVKNAGGNPLIVQADIANPDDRNRLVQQTLEHFHHIDLLVNNAGAAPAVRADILDLTEHAYRQVLDTNLHGPFLLTQAVAQHMIQTPNPPANRAIVNISSISAYTASVNRAEYCIAKAGIAMMSKLFATRLAQHNINVYEIRPGIIATDMTAGVKAKYDKLILEDGLTPIRRWGQPADVGGYYWPDRTKAAEVMRPSATFNAALERLVAATS